MGQLSFDFDIPPAIKRKARRREPSRPVSLQFVVVFFGVERFQILRVTPGHRRVDFSGSISGPMPGQLDQHTVAFVLDNMAALGQSWERPIVVKIGAVSAEVCHVVDEFLASSNGQHSHHHMLKVTVSQDMRTLVAQAFCEHCPTLFEVADLARIIVQPDI